MADNTHQSLERGLAVLHIVATAGKPISLAETAKHRAPHDASPCAHGLPATDLDLARLRKDRKAMTPSRLSTACALFTYALLGAILACVLTSH